MYVYIYILKCAKCTGALVTVQQSYIMGCKGDRHPVSLARQFGRVEMLIRYLGTIHVNNPPARNPIFFALGLGL